MEKPKYYVAAVRRGIIEILSSSKSRRVEKRELFSKCLKIFSLSAEEKRDRSPDGKYAKSKSVIGSVLSEMLREKTVISPDEGYFALSESVDAEELITDEKLEETIREIAGNSPLTKKQIFAMCDERYAGDKKEMHGRFGEVLARLVKSGELKKTGGEYSKNNAKFPNTELGNVLRDAYEGKDLKKCFLKALNLKGGEFFEEFSVRLFTAEFSGMGKVTKSEVTGGTTDNGVDGVIEYTDAMGFSERVLIQARTRSKGTITLKEVREFLGALTAEKGTKGIFVTTAAFHSEATKFLNRQINAVGINGAKLCALAEKNSIGITGKEIDYSMFIDL